MIVVVLVFVVLRVRLDSFVGSDGICGFTVIILFVVSS